MSILYTSLGAHVHAFLDGVYAGGALWGHGRHTFSFCRDCQFLQFIAPISPPTMYKFPQFLVSLTLQRLLELSQQTFWCVYSSISWWNLTFLMTNEDEHIFMSSFNLPFGEPLLVNASSSLLPFFITGCLSFSYSFIGDLILQLPALC